MTRLRSARLAAALLAALLLPSTVALAQEGEPAAEGSPGEAEADAGAPDADGPADGETAAPASPAGEDAEAAAEAAPAAGLPPRVPPPEGTGGRIDAPRDPPDYDGLPEPGTPPEEILLWIPRILTGPLYLFTEFVLRRPLGALMIELEQVDLYGLALDIFTFADNKIGLVPTIFYDFGFAPSVGLYFFWSDFLFDGNRIALNAGTFGPQWLNLVVEDRVAFNDATTLSARFQATRRPDQFFAGIGPFADLSQRSRFGVSLVDASLIFHTRFFGRSELEVEGGYRSASFRSGRWFGTPAIGEDLVTRGQSLPDGFTTGYEALRLGAQLILDTRPLRDRPSAGLMARAFLRANGAFGGLEGFNGWFHYGGGLGAATDILGDDRVLSLEADAEFISTVDGATVPFFELIDPSFGEFLGFQPGVLRGRSFVALTAAYEWPVWVFLAGRLFFGVGNVFGPELSNFDAEDLRMNFGIGIEPTLGADLPFELTFAFGTDRFRNGASIQSFRFFVGARNGL